MADFDKAKFGENLTRIRRSKKITQKSLAEMLNTSPTSVNYWEKGTTKPRLDMMQGIADALEVPLTSLIDWDEADAKFNPDGKLAESVRTLEQIEKEYGKEAVMLLEAFSQLNAVGMVKAMEYVSDLSEQDKYKK